MLQRNCEEKKFHIEHFLDLIVKFQDTEKKMIEIMEKSERSYLVCNVTKNTKKHIQLCH